MDAAAPSSTPASCRPRAGAPSCGSPRGTGPSTCTPCAARSAALLTMIATITAISGPGILRVMRRAASTTRMTPTDTSHVRPMDMRERARDVQELGRGVLARGCHPEHVRELSCRHLNADAGEESDKDGTGQEVRQEPEPGQPGEQQQPTGEQGREPGQLDVSRRPGGREPGEGRGEDGRGGGVRADDEVA